MRRRKRKINAKLKTLDDHQASLKVLLEERENSLQESETKLASLEQSTFEGSNQHGGNFEDLINKRFDKIDKNIDALIENKLAGVLGIPVSEASTSDNKKKLFSTAVGMNTGAENPVAALTTTRNAEIIERKEQEKRANNIIIHGISEVRPEDVALQKHDEDFITSFLDTIEVTIQPKQISQTKPYCYS